MLETIRIYKNAAGDTIRVDNIYLSAKRDNICIGANGTTQSGHVYQRDKIQKTLLHSTAGRVVAAIELVGTFDDTDTISGNYTWASWDSPDTRLGMDDLPAVGDTV